MAEKPILFSGDMVRTILAGAKTQTRRVIKPQPDIYCDGEWCTTDESGAFKPISHRIKVGDTMWVREAWRVGAWSENDGMRIQYRSDGRLSDWLQPTEEMFERLWVDSTDDAIKAGFESDENGDFYWAVNGQSPTRWRPSIFMPRWASRITLRVVDVRVQRVQDISEDDASAEGVQRHSGPYILDFAGLWDTINAKRGYSWNSNPWVWVVKFEHEK